MLYPSERDPSSTVRTTGCVVLALLLFAACLLPFLFIQAATAALQNLHLSPTAALLVLLGVFLGSFVNIPVVRYPTGEDVVVPVYHPFGGWFVVPQFVRLRQELVVAVNVGGCIIPVLLAVWLLPRIVAGGAAVIGVLAVGMVLNTVVCYWTARPIRGVGIALPFFLPALVALSVAWLGLGLDPENVSRGPVAFVIGITGPLVGADLLHWRDFQKISSGLVSIGGAGTWDGIVLSGLLAALLA